MQIVHFIDIIKVAILRRFMNATQYTNLRHNDYCVKLCHIVLVTYLIMLSRCLIKMMSQHNYSAYMYAYNFPYSVCSVSWSITVTTIWIKQQLLLCRILTMFASRTNVQHCTYLVFIYSNLFQTSSHST